MLIINKTDTEEENFEMYESEKVECTNNEVKRKD
jgi:hypothetical protein